MKILFSLVIFFTFVSCASNKGVYWCGDHACINKKEKEAYFKKTLIVEVKEMNEKINKNDSEVIKITKRGILDEKRRIKEEKDLAKQVKLDEKRRIKEKQKKDNRTLSKEKKIVKKIINTTNENVDEYSNTESNKIRHSKFNELVERIIKKNSFRPYPDINDIPN